MHGAIYLVLKTEGDVQRMVKGWVNHAIIVFVIGYATTTMATLIYRPEMTALIKAHPVLFVLPVLTMLAIANVPRSIAPRPATGGRSSRRARPCSACSPWWASGCSRRSCGRQTRPPSLTIYNAASSPATLAIMLIIALIGIPLVLAYTISIYWIFRGKVKLDSMSY